MEIEKVGEIWKIIKIKKRKCKKNSKNRKVGEILKVWGNRSGKGNRKGIEKKGR